MNELKTQTDKVIYTLKELVDLNIQSVPFLWDGILPQSGVGFITGPSDSNKSTFIKQLA